MSKKYKEYSQLNLKKTAEDITEFWEANNVFQKSVENRSEDNNFVFFEGPPSANGLPGIHHVIGRTIKDLFARYKTMNGYRVNRKAGWDTHGLPVELSVEKELNITKENIGKTISIDDYNKACKSAVMRYTDIWNDLTRRIGYWVDMEDPYITYRSKYMESVWWLLKQIYDKGLLYKGYTIQPYSPKAGTGLSSHELNQPGCYKDVTDTTITAQFKLEKQSLDRLPFTYNDKISVYFLAWTTTPWTLPSNTALTVGKNIDYILVETYNQYTFEPIQVILAQKLVNKQFGKKYVEVKEQTQLSEYKKEYKKIPYLIKGQCKGVDLLELRYEQLLPFVKPAEHSENAFRVIAGDFVTTEDGTGIVHTAPTFGQDDAGVAKQAQPEIPPMLVKNKQGDLVPLVNTKGQFIEHMGEYAGKYVKNDYYNDDEMPDKSVDVEIAIQLKTENKAFHVEKHKHSYPHCWRTDKPVLYYPLDSWFIRISEVKDQLYNHNKHINWKPKATGEGRFGNWLQNANDWNLSRSRFWGIPLPIWRTEDKSEELIIGSVEELIKAIEQSIDKGYMSENPYKNFVVGDMTEENYNHIDLHKNIVDQIILVSPKGKPMRRESDLIDVWFDSGSMPVAQWHYPFEEVPKHGSLTADFIAEGVDQTRGWFYTLHAIAGLVFDNVAYKNVVSNGLVLDKFGKKMSKRLGNAIDPFKTLDDFGPDPIRWYMIANANPWDNLKFDLEGVDEVRRKFFGTLYNTYSFFALYANLDEFSSEENQLNLSERSELDRWILSELHTLIKKVKLALDDYESTKAARDIQYFVNEHLSNWFVRLSRRRFWKGEQGQDKTSAYQTLYTCLLTVAKLGAPMAPFFMDQLYKDLTQSLGDAYKKISVHLENFPVYDEQYVDKDLERKMEKAQLISSMTLSLRQLEKIKVRQPLQRIMIPVHDEQERQDIKSVEDLIKAEVNVKTIELLDNASGILVKTIKPNFKLLGPRFGQQMKEISKTTAQMSQDDITRLERTGGYVMQLLGEETTLSIDDFEIKTKDIEGWKVAHESGVTVALDISITDDLRYEGIARELVNRIQNIRKNSGFEVNDRIAITFAPDQDSKELITTSVSKNEIYISNETLIDKITFADILEDAVEVEFDELKVKIQVKKL